MIGYGTGGVADWRAVIAIDSRRMRAAVHGLMVPRHERQDADREIQDLPILGSQLSGIRVELAREQYSVAFLLSIGFIEISEPGGLAADRGRLFQDQRSHGGGFVRRVAVSGVGGTGTAALLRVVLATAAAPFLLAPAKASLITVRKCRWSNTRSASIA